MATSGSTDLTFDARAAVTFALNKLRVIAGGETPSAPDAETAQQELNLMLKGWMKYESLWRYTEASATPTDATAAVTLSPVPHRVTSARYYDGTNEMPLALLTREEYYDLPQKTNTGVPTCFYVDYQRAAATMYIWPVIATVGTKRIKYTYLRKFEDVDSLDNDIDIRQEHFETVGYNLAARLADDFGRAGPVIDRIIARAEQMLQTALDEDREDEIRFVPDYQAMA